MNLHFIVGRLGEVDHFGKILNKQFNQLDTHSQLRKCGTFNCLDNYGGITALTLDFCLDDISMYVKSINPTTENLIFSGAGLSLYIKEIAKHYPTASIYLIKSSQNKLETDASFKETLLMLVEDITEEWLLKINEKINFIIFEFEKTNTLIWRSIPEIPENFQVAKI